MYTRETELWHYGVKGMKWGVRRYQNYDGSYTRAGLERYNKASSDYESAKSNYKSTKESYKSGTASKSDVQSAKSEAKQAKSAVKNAKTQLKADNRADKGKKLYAKGETITENERNSNLVASVSNLIGAGSIYAGTKVKNQKATVGLFAAGGAAVLAGDAYAAKKRHDNKLLRAYYAH